MRPISLIAVSFALVALFTVTPAHAQAREDTQLWTEVSGSAELSKSAEIGVEQALRLGAEAGFERAHTDLELSYRWHDMVATAVHYRLLVYENETRHRVAGDIDLRAELGRLQPSYRFRLQATGRENDDTLTVIRNQFELAYDAPKRLEPFVALELFHAVSPVSEFREHRISLGCEWGLTKRTDLSGFIRVLREHNVATPDEFLIFGLALSHSFREVD